ncbi:hypothetical protein FB479_10837 [Brevibacillus sp. AG162]|nr:hypothetical protein FB479_10837 [Brevibacillus sp. AG162]
MTRGKELLVIVAPFAYYVLIFIIVNVAPAPVRRVAVPNNPNSCSVIVAPAVRGAMTVLLNDESDKVGEMMVGVYGVPFIKILELTSNAAVVLMEYEIR